MEYQFKCNVYLGMGCCGISYDEDDEVTVDLTDEEAEQIRKRINPETNNVLHEISSKLPEVCDKILDEVIPFVYFVVANDARESGLWRDCIRSNRDIDDFIREDVRKRIIDNTDDKGKRLPKEKLYNIWKKHEEEYIHSLPYNEAFNYISKRYGCAPDNIDTVTYDIELPDELIAD